MPPPAWLWNIHCPAGTPSPVTMIAQALMSEMPLAPLAARDGDLGAVHLGGEVDRVAGVAEVGQAAGVGRVLEPLDGVAQAAVRGGEAVGPVLDDAAVVERRGET